MTMVLNILNFAAVGLFGIFLSAAFCDITWTKKNKIIFAVSMGFMGVMQAFTFVNFGAEVTRAWYPVITHLPLVVVLIILCRKIVWSMIAVFTAYLCCQVRRWLALFFTAVFFGGETMQVFFEVLITVPLCILIVKYAAVSVRYLSRQSHSTQLQFGLLPMIYYVFDYMTRVYTSWLTTGFPVATEFMMFGCAVAQLIFAVRSDANIKHQLEMERVQTVLDMQVKSAIQQLDSMKKSQEQAAAYRHDLRHHLQYISSCLESGSMEQAQEYIRSLNNEITNQTVKKYCLNTAANLILSVFVTRAHEKDIEMTVHMELGEVLPVSDTDLCVLLSNGLENALHAAAAAQAATNRAAISIRGYEKENRIFLEIINSCSGEVVFEKGIPVTKEVGHGTGVKSICAVVEKYDGMYSFELKENTFILRMSL